MRVCEVKSARLRSQRQLSFVALSTAVEGRGAGRPRSAAFEPGGAVRAAKWTDYSSLVGCQQVFMEAGALSVPWSDSLRRNVIRNATMVEDRPGGLAGGVGGTHCVM